MEDKNSDPWFQDPMTVDRRLHAGKLRRHELKTLLRHASDSEDARVRQAATAFVQYDIEVQNLGGKGVDDAWN